MIITLNYIALAYYLYLAKIIGFNKEIVQIAALPLAARIDALAAPLQEEGLSLIYDDPLPIEP